MNWPTFFPDNCPPDDACEATGIVYRFVKHDPPDQRDFTTNYERQTDKIQTNQLCSACGISVFRDLSDAPKMQRIIRHFQSYSVARGTITPDLGVIKHTPGKIASHHDWWIPIGKEPWKRFEIVTCC